MGEHKCEDNLEHIAKSVQDYRGTVCGDIAPFVEFYCCKLCNKLMFLDNPGIEDYGRKEVYRGALTTEELRRIVPRIKYDSAHSLAQE